MTDKEKPKTLGELIASTPAAQPLSDALENIRVRRKRLLDTKTAPTVDSVITPEAIPVIDNPDAFAKDFWERKQAEKRAKPKAPKGKPTKAPHLTVHDGDDPKKK